MNQTIEYLIVFSIGLFYSILVTFRVIYGLVTKGIKTVQGVNFRSRPKILTDPRFGKSAYVHLKDVTLHYVENGDPRKPLMLLVHGFPEFWFSWRHQLDSDLNKKFRIVAIDMRGYGESDKPKGAKNYITEKLVEDIRQVIQTLGYTSCYLVGHDWGGAVAWRFAITHPSMVTKLAILNCPHPAAFRSNLRSSWAQFVKSWYMFFFQLPCYPEWLVSRQNLVSLDIALKGIANPQELEAFKYTFSSACAFTGPINYYRAAFRYPGNLRNAGGNKKLEVPTTLIFGAEDKYISEKSARLSAKYCEQLNFQLVPNASHWVQQDAPDQVNRLLARFFLDNSDDNSEGGGDILHGDRRSAGSAKKDAERLRSDLSEH